MAEVSHETKQLEQLAGDLEDFDAEELIVNQLGDAGLPTHLWPLMGQLIASGPYHDVYNKSYEACQSLNALTDALGGTVRSIASHYREMEEQYGTDYDALGAEIENE